MYYSKSSASKEAAKIGILLIVKIEQKMATNEKSSNEELLATMDAVLQKASSEQKAYIAGAIAVLESMASSKAVEQ